jgi:transcriptional regulator with XRE-family HTH domain
MPATYPETEIDHANPIQMNSELPADHPNEDDKRIGARLRFWRRTLNSNPKQLAKKLNITYQQLQKYERGINRISASRLHRIALELQVPINFFYQDLDPVDTGVLDGLAENREEELTKIAGFVTEKTALELSRALNSIQNPLTRKAIIGLITDVANSR